MRTRQTLHSDTPRRSRRRGLRRNANRFPIGLMEQLEPRLMLSGETLGSLVGPPAPDNSLAAPALVMSTLQDDDSRSTLSPILDAATQGEEKGSTFEPVTTFDAGEVDVDAWQQGVEDTWGNSSNYSISDYNYTYSNVSVNVPSGSTITDVEYRVRIEHTYPGDLDVWIISPDGTSKQIWNNYGGGDDGGYDDDSADDDDIYFNYRGTSSFDGEDPDGTWKLKVYDNYGGDTGQIDYFYVRINYDTAPQYEPPGPDIENESVPSSITLGDWASVSFTLDDDYNGDVDEGYISVSFPDLDGYGDASYVYNNGSSSDLSYSEYDRGDSIWHKDGSQDSAEYLLIDGYDSSWSSGEGNTLSFRVKPQSTGTFDMYVRGHLVGDDGNLYKDPNSSSYTDQQDWPVYRYTIQVNEPAKPDLDAYISTSGSYNWGDQVGMTLEVENEGNASSGSFGIDLVASNDSTLGNGDDITLDSWSSSLGAGGVWGMSYGYTLPTQPLSGFSWSDRVYFGLIADTVSGETDTGDNDDYDYVNVSAPAAPSPDLEWVSGIPATAYVGEPFTVTLQAENDANVGKLGSSITASVGHTSGTSGRVSVSASKPSWADSDDWGWNLLAPGSGTIYHKDNGAMTPQDWFIEAAEDNWTSGESHQMSFTVTPDATGTIVIRTRTTMTNYENWYNDTSASGGYEWVDQQGWAVREYAVNVEQRRPDLVADLNALNEPYHWGEGAGFEMSVVNNGNASSGGFWVDLVASNDSTIGDGDDVLIEDWYISDLNANGGLWGQSWATTLPSSPWSGFNWDDTIYFGLHAYAVSGETSTSNNKDYDSVPVSPPLADLQGNTFDSTEPLLAGGSADLTYTIDNDGNGDASGFNVKFYISPDSTITTADREIGYEWISGVPANTCTLQLTETVWLPGSTDSFWNGNGTYYLGMIVDPEGNVDEVTTSNNANRGNGIDRDAVTVNGASETGNVEYTLYRISDTSGTPHTSSPGSSRSTFLANETVRVTMRANNSGNAVDSEAVLNLLDPSGPPAFYDSYLVGDRPSEYLSTGETAYYSFDISLSGAATGWYDVLGSIRNDNDWDTVLDTTAPGRADADFENATLQDQFQVVHKPDLVADIDALNEPWKWGETVGFEMQVTNEGSANASPFWVDLVMTDYNGDNVEILDSWYLSSGLSAGNLWGQSYAYTLPDVPPTGYEYSGDVYFWLMADVDESNDDWYLGDNDDSDAVPMTLAQPDPDLLSVSSLPSSVEVGETITVTVLAENDGDAAGQNSSLSASVLYADGSDTAGNLIVTGPTNYGSVDYTALRTPGDAVDIYDSAGNPMTAQDWLVEIGDHDWTSGEQHSMTFTVTPQQAGQLVLRVRTTQTDAYGTPFTDHSVTGGTSGTDQQGFAVEEYVINVSQPFEVLDTSISTNTTRDGRTVTLGYQIASTTSQQVWLGATLTGPGGEIIEDADNDDTVTVSAGTNWYYRDFRVNMHPNPVSGYYDVTWGVHWGTSGETYVTDEDALGIQSPIAVELPIIMYHKIDDVVRSQYYVDTDMFESQMRALRAYGWDPITLDDLADMRAGIKSIPDKPIMITADDGYENWLTEATPVLQDLANEGWDVTMVGAIPTGRLGGTNAWDTGAIAEEGVAINHLTWSQVQQLHNTGLWDLQSHSHMHPDLTTLSPSQLEYEVTQSKSLLESHLNKDVDWMLYPFGAQNLAVQEALHDADYFGAVNAWGGIEPNSYDKWTLDRIMIDDDDSVDWDPNNPGNFFMHKIGENIAVPDMSITGIDYLDPATMTPLASNEVAPGSSVLVRVHAYNAGSAASTTVSLNVDDDADFGNGVLYDSHVEGEDVGMSILPGAHTFQWTVDIPADADLGQYYTAVGFHDVHYVLGFAYSGWLSGFRVAEPGANFNPYFYDARIVNPLDSDQDGFAREMTLQFDVDSEEPGNYYVKVFQDGVGSPLLTTTDYHVDGYAYDWHDVTLSADAFGWSNGTVDLRLEMYDASNDTLLATRSALMDSSLNDVAVELTSQDSPYEPVVDAVRITNGIDQDLDGYVHQYDVEFDVTAQIGTGSYFIKVYDWATQAPLGQTAVSTSSVGSTDTVSLTLNVDDGGFRHSTRALKLELYKAGSDHLVATHTSSAFLALGSIDVEPSADDVAEPGDTLSTARNLGNLNATGLYTEREELGDGPFGDQDIDLYRVRVTQEGDLTADVDAQGIGLSSLDAYLRIFDSAGIQIAYNDDQSGSDEDPMVTAFVQPGTYYIGVSARENRLYDVAVGGSAHATPGNLGAYEVEISLASSQPPVGGEYSINEYITIYGEYELTTSGNVQTAQGTVSVNNILTVYGSISFDNDLDVWGNGEVVLENLPVLGDMQLYEGEFEFNGSDLITDTFNDYASALQVVGMDVHASSIRLVQDGVEVRGYIHLPNVLTPNPDSDPIQLDIDGAQFIRINTNTGEVTYDMTLEVPEVKLVAGGLTFEAQDAAINLTNDPLLKATLTGTYMLDIPPYLDGLMVDLSVDQGRYLSFDENFDLEFNGAISADEIQIVQNVVYIEDLLIELDSVEQRYYGAGVIGLPIGDGVEIGAEVEFINGHLNTVGLVGNDLDIPVWGAPPIYLQRAGGSVSGLYTGPLVISPVLSLSAGPTIKGYSLLRLDGEVDIDLSGRVDGRVAVYVVGDEDNALANGQMRVIWDKSYGVYLSGALNAGFVDGEPTFTVNGQAALDNYGNFQGRLNGTAQIPSTVPVIGSILDGQQVSTTVYTQVYDDSDQDNDYLIGSIMIDLPLIGEVEHAIELNYNTGKIDWNASLDRVKTVTFPGVQDLSAEGLAGAMQMSEQERTFQVASNVEWVILRAGWETGDTDLTLVDPLGNLITPANVDTYANIEYVKSATEAYYVVASPDSGPWVLDVTNPAGIGELTLQHLQHADAGTIEMYQPATPQAGSPVLLEWTAEDSDSDAVISLYYDTDQTGADGTLIATGISEDSDPSSWAWDTSNVPAGEYYVYAVIDDAQEGTPGDIEYGHFTPKISYAPGRVTVADPQAPGQVTGLTADGGSVDADAGTATAMLTWSAPAGDVDHYVVRTTATASGEEYTDTRAASDTDVTLTGLTAGETYRVNVSAVTVLRNVEGDIQSIHTGPASDAIVLVAGANATVAPGTDEWYVFAPAGQMYSAKVPGADDATYTPVNLPSGAQLNAAGQFEWFVPATGGEGWHEVLVHVTHADGTTSAERFWLLVDSLAPQWQSPTAGAVVLSSTAVEITAPLATDASGALLYRFERNGQILGDWQLQPTFTDTALAPNATYSYRVQARDASTGELISDWTAPVTATTHAAVASAPQLGQAGVNTLEVLGLAPDANPAGTEYALRNVTEDTYVAADGSALPGATWQQAGDWAGVVLSGLAADTTYGLGVFARNADGIVSEIGEIAYATTNLEDVLPTVASVDVGFSSGNIRIEFTEAVDLDRKDIEIVNRTTGQVVDLAGATFLHDQGSNVVEVRFDNALADGLYELRLIGSSVQDLAANLLAGDGATAGTNYTYQFHRLFCDANGDMAVDIYDALIWQSHYDPLGEQGYGYQDGDFNGDGFVNIYDIMLWQMNYDPVGLQ